MNRDLERSIKKLERGIELADEEAMHGERIAQTLELNEDLEEKYDVIKKLEKQIKLWRRVSVIELVILIIVLLYACVTYIQSHPKQVVVEKTLSYTQDMPELDLSEIESITIGQLIGTFGSGDVLMHPNGEYMIDSDYPAGEVLYPAQNFDKAFCSLRRSYTLGGEEMTCEDHSSDYHMTICTAYYDEGDTLTRGDMYISRETLKTSTLDFASAPNHNGHIKEHVIFSIYGDTEIDAKEVFLGVLEEQPVGDVSFTDNPDGGYSTHWDWQLNMRRIAKELAKKMPEVEFSLRSEDFFCSTYDIVEHNERYIICRRDEKKYIPKVVTTYEIDVTSYEYNEYACTIHNF